MPLQVLSIPAKLPLQPAEGKQFLVRRFLMRVLRGFTVGRGTLAVVWPWRAVFWPRDCLKRGKKGS